MNRGTVERDQSGTSTFSRLRSAMTACWLAFCPTRSFCLSSNSFRCCAVMPAMGSGTSAPSAGSSPSPSAATFASDSGACATASPCALAPLVALDEAARSVASLASNSARSSWHHRQGVNAFARFYGRTKLAPLCSHLAFAGRMRTTATGALRSFHRPLADQRQFSRTRTC